MRIEQAIKQKKFENEYQKLLVNLLYTTGQISSAQSRLLKPYGISIQQYNVLRILRGQHPKSVSVSVVAERMLDKNSNASRLIDKLVKKKLIKRKVSECDRRQKNVVITASGLKFLEPVDKKIREFQKHFEIISVNDAKKVNKILDQLRK